MKKTKKSLSNKIVIFSLLIVFLLANFSLVFAPPTTAFIEVKPDPVGVGQSVLVCLRVEPSPPTGENEESQREGITVEVTVPDGYTEILGPLATDFAGKTEMLYTPTMVGTYSFQMSFPGYTSSVSGDVYSPSASSIETVHVQQDPVEIGPEDLTCDIPENDDPCCIWKIIIIILIIIIIILGVLLLRKTKKT